MKTVLYDYQEKTAADIVNRMHDLDITGAYIGFETGTGKTVTALSIAERLKILGHIDGVIVICPVSKVDDWERDIAYELPDMRYYVTSFQSAWRDKASSQIYGLLEDTHRLLIVDEGHKMKTYDSKQSKFIQKLATEISIPHVLILSATSQNKKYIDLYPQYKALGSPVFNRSAKDFKKDYCIEAANYNLVYAGKARFPFHEIVGYKNTDLMNKEILRYTYYKKYESEYDRPIEIPQYFKMTSDMKYFRDKKVWPRMDEDALKKKLEAGDITDMDMDFVIANRPTLHHIYMRESCSGFIRDKFLKDNPKAQWLNDFLEGNEGRIVVFTNFINETEVVKNICEKNDRHYVIYDGGHKDLSAWHEYEDCIAIVNIQAGSAGLNDFITTNIAIYFSPPENYIDFEQSKGRIDRIGQTKQPVYYYLQIAGSIEPQIYKSLAEGQSFDLTLFLKWTEEMK